MAEPAAADNRGKLREPQVRGRRILLVDADKASLGAWADFLNPLGVVVELSTSMVEARRALANVAGSRLDYAIIEDRLPDGSGCELARHLGDLAPPTHFAVVSADRSDERIMESWRQDITILPKPTTREALWGLVQRLEERRFRSTSLPPERPLILVIDDSPAAIEMCRTSLAEDYRVEVANDGYVGFRRAIELRPDVIVSDFVMPGLDGVQLIRLLRARQETVNVPVVLVTGQADEALRQRVLRDGAQDYLTKPFSAQELRTRVGNLVMITRSKSLLTGDAKQTGMRLDAAVAQVMTQKRHAVFLADASKLLFESSLEYRAGLSQIIRMFTSSIADAALVDLINVHGEVENVALAHVEPAAEQTLRRVREDYPPKLTERHPLVPALFKRNVEMLNGADSGGLLQALEMRSGICIPLLARDRLLGALTVYSASEARPLTTWEQTVAGDLGRRIALSVDHADLYQEAKAAVAARDEFLSIASHELKTPLNPLLLHVQSLKRKAREFVVEGQRERVTEKLEAISRQTERLSRLINDLLDNSRITAGKVEFKLADVDLSDVADSMIALFRDCGEVARASCSLRVELTPGLTGHWDRARLDQVVTNLLSNALKYGAGSQVTVSTRLEGNSAMLRVGDRGIGIKPEDHARIFDRFERAVSVTHYGGLGLGLYIVKQLVEGLGGKVWVESRGRALPASDPHVDDTTVFYVVLPLSGPEVLPDAPTRATV